MKILSIETSCDETAVALLSVSKTKIKICGNALFSQASLHEEYGGVFPNLARREHQKNLTLLLSKALGQKLKIKKQKINLKTQDKINKIKEILKREPELLKEFEEKIIFLKKPKIDRIAVTQGPGLEPALWVGISFAKALGELWGVPVQGVNHMEGHIWAEILHQKSNIKSNEYEIRKIKFPALALLVSGGHTELVLIKKLGSYKIVGQTRDDAVGEAFDKVARLLGLPYPGGPQISHLATKARNQKQKNPLIVLPRPMMYTKDFDFSFSGLKTAVLYLTHKIKPLDSQKQEDIALEFENAVVEVLVHKTKKALEHFKARTLIVGGGVSANTFLRQNLTTLAEDTKTDILLPTPDMATDNAVMIGIVAGLRSQKPTKKPIKAEGNLSL